VFCYDLRDGFLKSAEYVGKQALKCVVKKKGSARCERVTKYVWSPNDLVGRTDEINVSSATRGDGMGREGPIGSRTPHFP